MKNSAIYLEKIDNSYVIIQNISQLQQAVLKNIQNIFTMVLTNQIFVIKPEMKYKTNLGLIISILSMPKDYCIYSV